MSDTKVSVILPSLNVKEYIAECIQSVCNQTLRDIEIICVDAGSTDGTLELIEQAENADSRIKLVKSPKKSYGLQMNLGVQHAHGKYIAIVETDDYILPNMLNYLYEVCERNDLDFAKADFYRFTREDNGEEIRYLNQLSAKSEYYNRVINPRVEKEVFTFVMNTWSGIYKKNFLEKEKIFHNETPGASFQDTSFWFQTFSKAKRVYFVNKPFYMNRRDNPNSSVYSTKKTYAFCDEYAFLYEQLFSNGANKDLMPQFQLYRYKAYMSSLNKCQLEEKENFIKKFKKDLLDSRNKGELDLSLFTSSGKKTVELLLDKTETFIERQKKVKPPVYRMGSNSRQIIRASKKMESGVDVSVVIPFFNAEKYICKTLDSVLSQTLRNIEVIAVDDGSTDDSLSVLKRYCDQDDRIALLTQPNSGSGPARNYGMKVAKGKYIAFIDADDWYPDKDVLIKLYNAAEQNNAKICGGSFSNWRDGKVTTQFTGVYQKYTFIKAGFQNFKDYQFDYGYHRFIYERELIQTNNLEFPPLLRYQDPPFFLKIMTIAKEFYAIPDVVYCYRKGHNKVLWTREKIEDLLTGILFEIDWSKDNSLTDVHGLAVDRVNSDFFQPIAQFAIFDNPKIIELLFRISNSIDRGMLSSYGYRIEVDKNYLVKPLREFRKRVSNNVVSITLHTVNGDCQVPVLKSGSTSFETNKKVQELTYRLNRFNDRYEKLRNGISYRIGRTVTFIPRMLMKICGKK
ncbi:MAG: hypothetical protein DBX45_05415 [Oscillospiraceae bacterium]|nr:MAG: hypothetical protein DBX45_05415 [Oscillospiraceae bacterium]